MFEPAHFVLSKNGSEMEDKNNCSVDPFLENTKEQDEVLIEVFFECQFYTWSTFQAGEQSDKVNMFAKFSKGRVKRLTGPVSRIITKLQNITLQILSFNS